MDGHVKRESGMLQTSRILIIGKGTKASLRLCEHFSATNVEHAALSFAESMHLDDYGEFSVAFVCADASSESAAMSRVPDLTALGIPAVLVVDTADGASPSTASRTGVVEVLELPLTTRRIDNATDIAYYRRKAMRYHIAMEEHSRQLDTLSPRELRVVQLAADGAPNKQIANTVGLSVKSIERIRREAYRKLNVRSTAEMTRVVLLGSLFQYSDSQESVRQSSLNLV